MSSFYIGIRVYFENSRRLREMKMLHLLTDQSQYKWIEANLPQREHSSKFKQDKSNFFKLRIKVNVVNS